MVDLCNAEGFFVSGTSGPDGTTLHVRTIEGDKMYGDGFEFTSYTEARKFALEMGYLQVWAPKDIRGTAAHAGYVKTKTEEFLNG